MFVFVWITSFGKMSSESIHVATNGIISFFFLWLSNIPLWASVVTQMVKNLPAIQETWLWSLGWQDPLAEGMTTRSSILA